MKQDCLLPRQPQHLAQALALGADPCVCLMQSGKTEA